METVRARGLAPHDERGGGATIRENKKPAVNKTKESKKVDSKQPDGDDSGDDWRDDAKITLLKVEGTKTAHEARKVVTYDMRRLLCM